jgi:hypothetical protein
MLPNIEQMKSLARWALAWASGIATGYLGAKGVLTADQLSQVAGFFNSETVVTLLVSGGAAVWGLVTHTQTNAVAVVAEMPDTSVTNEGRTIQVLAPALASAAKAAAPNPVGAKK